MFWPHWSLLGPYGALGPICPFWAFFGAIFRALQAYRLNWPLNSSSLGPPAQNWQNFFWLLISTAPYVHSWELLEGTMMDGGRGEVRLGKVGPEALGQGRKGVYSDAAPQSCPTARVHRHPLRDHRRILIPYRQFLPWVRCQTLEGDIVTYNTDRHLTPYKYAHVNINHRNKRPPLGSRSDYVDSSVLS